MELRAFVQATIQQIIDGITDAQNSSKESGAIINPAVLRYKKDGQFNAFHQGMPTSVEFDVALVSTEKKGSTEGIGVFLGGVSLGKKNDSGAELVSHTKVRFTVPILLPTDASGRPDA